MSTFKALSNRNYALFFYGQAVSQIGTWMQRTAVSWVVYSMTHSAFMLGLAVFMQQFPSFAFSFVGGVVADRYNRYKLLLLTQAASMVQAVLLAFLTLSNNYTVTGILALSVLLGIINAFDVPARQPLVHELVNDKSEIPNALALNASLVNLARLIGPALSGIVLEAFGAGVCFSLNALSFVAVLVSLLMMKLQPRETSVERKPVFAEFAEGFQYIRRDPAISVSLLMLMTCSLLVLPYDTLVPVISKVIFKGDAATYGYISSFVGLGAVCGSLFLASLKNRDRSLVLVFTTAMLGIGLILFSQTSNFPVAMLFAVLTGFGAMSITTLCLTIIQLQAKPEMIGRVMSYVAMAYFGMLPLGSLIVGSLSHAISASHTLLLQGILALAVSMLYYRYLTRVKPIELTSHKIS